MPYFTDVNTHLVVYRQYEINAEAIDGRIVVLEDKAVCCLVSHVPNKKFGYDVDISDEGTAEYCFDKKDILENPNSSVYYSVVAKTAYDDYINNDKFFPAGVKEVTEPVRNEPQVTIHIDPPQQTQPKKPKRRRKVNSLARTNESATYIYKSPNSR